MCICGLAGVRSAVEACGLAGVAPDEEACDPSGTPLAGCAPEGALSLAAAELHKDASRMKRAPSRVIGQEPMVARICFGGLSCASNSPYAGFFAARISFTSSSVRL